MKTLILLSLLLLLLLPFAYATEVSIDKYEFGAYVSTVSLGAVHPSASATDSAEGQTFRTNYDGANVTVLQVYLQQVSATGNVTAKISGHSGTWSSSGVPNGTVLATSDPVNITSYVVLTVVNFTFPTGVVLSAAETYTWHVEGTSGDVSLTTFGADNSYYTHGGNAFLYENSAWVPLVTYDVLFALYGEGGDLVSYNMGGDVYITEITEVTNVTSSPTVNVTTGDVNVGGVTAEFNNTVVNATGSAITAGDVSAGDVTAAGAVTANGAITMGGDLSVNGTFDNATLTYVTSTAVSGDANVYFLIAFIALAVLLTFYNKVPLMNFLVGIVGISFITLSFQNTDLPFWPYSSVLLALVSLLCMISGGFKMRNN